MFVFEAEYLHVNAIRIQLILFQTSVRLVSINLIGSTDLFYTSSLADLSLSVSHGQTQLAEIFADCIIFLFPLLHV